MEPVTFTPRTKPPTLTDIWLPFFILFVFILPIAFLKIEGFVVFCIIELLLYIGQIFSKYETQVVIYIEDKVFEYYYLDCWGEEKLLAIDILTAYGSYKHVKISKSKFGWQLKFQNDKTNKITISQGTFEKFQLDQMVRMINQIKKGFFVADVGTAF